MSQGTLSPSLFGQVGENDSDHAPGLRSHGGHSHSQRKLQAAPPQTGRLELRQPRGPGGDLHQPGIEFPTQPRNKIVAERCADKPGGVGHPEQAQAASVRIQRQPVPQHRHRHGRALDGRVTRHAVVKGFWLLGSSSFGIPTHRSPPLHVERSLAFGPV